VCESLKKACVIAPLLAYVHVYVRERGTETDRDMAIERYFVIYRVRFVSLVSVRNVMYCIVIN